MTARTLRPLPALFFSILIVFRVFARVSHLPASIIERPPQQQSLCQPFGTISALEGLLNAEWGSATFPRPPRAPFQYDSAYFIYAHGDTVSCAGSGHIHYIFWIDFYQQDASVSSTPSSLPDRGKRKVNRFPHQHQQLRGASGRFGNVQARLIAGPESRNCQRFPAIPGARSLTSHQLSLRYLDRIVLSNETLP